MREDHDPVIEPDKAESLPSSEWREAEPALWAATDAVLSDAQVDGLWGKLHREISPGESAEQPAKVAGAAPAVRLGRASIWRDRGGEKRGFGTWTLRSEGAILPRSTPMFRMWIGFAILILLAVTGHQIRGVKRDAVSRTYTSAEARRVAVTLQDGSRVVLGPSTTLVVTPSANRLIATLQGEAAFTVSHHRYPIRVRAGNTVVRVLGTMFSVRRYTSDHATRIIVAEGRVSVRNTEREHGEHGEEYVMAAGALGIADDSGHVRVVGTITPDAVTAWVRGELLFSKIPVSDVLADLSRAYGADIRVGDSALARQRLTWNVSTTTQSLAEVLDELPFMLDAHIQHVGPVFLLVPGRIPSRKGVALPSFAPESRYGR